ncbi:MAG: branched-chain amino acid aminotransferase [Tissierellia bacterium]|nr:branched-chain amino acid aminotransferase [Tissierellia bacterium]
MKIISDNNVKNNKIITKEEMELILQTETPEIYEVIRVIEGKTVFLEEHFDRMNESIRLSGNNDKLDFYEYKSSAELLIRENNLKNCNIRVSYYNKDYPVSLFYFIESYYPSKEEFKEGIHTVTIEIERKNPNVKSYQREFKDKLARIMKENNAFEVILLNSDGTVSEGSRSNVFFVKGNKLITSPDSAVLLGVTRSKVVSLCEKNSIEVERRRVKLEELKDFDAAFITGTSNDVLPINTVDSMVYNSSDNEVVKRVSELYLEEVMKEVKR